MSEPMKIDLRPLAKALRSAMTHDGPVKRRRLRSKIHALVKRLLADVDVGYPAPPRKAPKKRRRAKGKDWAPVLYNAESQHRAAVVAAAGIRIRRASDGSVSIPRWTEGIPAKHLKACAKDYQLRRALMAEVALKKHEELSDVPF